MQTSMHICKAFWGVFLILGGGCRAIDGPVVGVKPILRGVMGARAEMPRLVLPPSRVAIATAAQLRQQGLQYRNQGNVTAAISTFQSSVETDPTNLNGHVMLGWTLHLDRQTEAATAALKAALAWDDTHVPALNALGIVYLVAGQLPAAVETHTRAIALQADNEVAHYNLALAYHRLKQFDPGIEYAQQATLLEPQNPHPQVALALLHWANGSPELARDAYRQAVALDGRYRQTGYLSHLTVAGFTEMQVERVREILGLL